MVPLHHLDGPGDLAAIGDLVITWYEQHARNLPWRQTSNPYAIWVAEVMLQQTRVETVLPYYARFLARFPTVDLLAEAPLDDVLKLWQGLGYYARARNLHAAARRVAADLGGQIPSTSRALRRLPGIGVYTAAAVASIAFDEDVVALDGNLLRVLCRLFAVDDDPGRPRTRRALQELAQLMLVPGRAGDYNQAMMDLGATVCLPSNPRCLLCPIQTECHARAEGIQNELPIRATRTHHPHRDVTAAVIGDGNGRILITQRPLDGLLGGMWEFPGGKRRPGEDLAACLRREIDEELGIEVSVGDLLCTVDHAFTHFHMTLYAFRCAWLSGTPQLLGCIALRWVTFEELAQFAFPVADLKIIAALSQQGTGAL